MNHGTDLTVVLVMAVMISIGLMAIFGHRPWRTWFQDDDINNVAAGQDEDDPGAS